MADAPQGPHFEVLTLFPEMVRQPLSLSVLGRAQVAGRFSVGVTDIRDHAEGKHRVCDDVPYGGGAGMVMKPEPTVRAIEAAKERLPGARVVLMGPRGKRFTQAQARLWSQTPRLILVCGRYEGLDERVQPYIDEEWSVGDFVLTGGEFAALCVVDAVARLLPGVLGNQASTGSESFEDGLLEYPQYTRPPEFRGQQVPDVLLSGNHAAVARWRRAKALEVTRERRPDLFRAWEERTASPSPRDHHDSPPDVESDTHAGQADSGS